MHRNIYKIYKYVLFDLGKAFNKLKTRNAFALCMVALIQSTLYWAPLMFALGKPQKSYFFCCRTSERGVKAGPKKNFFEAREKKIRKNVTTKLEVGP